MVTAFANAPFTSVEREELLREGGKFTWAAGPLAKCANLCHALFYPPRSPSTSC
jgi:hypothetical protein